MGCSVSVNIESNLDQQSTRLVVVDRGDDSNEDAPGSNIQVYRLQKRFQFENSMELPNQVADDMDETGRDGLFSLCCHINKPMIYLTGNVPSEEEKANGVVLKVDLSSNSSEPQPDVVKSDWLPATYAHVSCVCLVDGVDFLYLIGRNQVCFRLNLSTFESEPLVDIPVDMEDISRVQCCQGLLVMATDDNDIWCFDPPQDPDERWVCRSSFQLPKGKIAITNGSLYFFQLDDISIYKCDLRGKLNKLVIVDLSTTAARRTTHLIVSGEFAYLLGYLHSMERISLVEIHLLDRYSLIAGYLNDTSKNHTAYLCLACQ